MTKSLVYKLCKKGHPLKPNNIIWSIGIHGKYQRKCKKCDNARRALNPNIIAKARARAKRNAAKKRANKLQFLNVTGIINGIMGYAA